MINQIRITDFNAPELDIYARTKEVVLLNRAKPEDGIFIAESPKVIERALDSGCEPISILMEERHIEGEGKSVLERCGDIPVTVAVVVGLVVVEREDDLPVHLVTHVENLFRRRFQSVGGVLHRLFEGRLGLGGLRGVRQR